MVGDVLVRVRACALNHLDLWVRRGLPRVTIPMPHIPGSDRGRRGRRVGGARRRHRPARHATARPQPAAAVRPASRGGTTSVRPTEVLGYRHHNGGYAEFVKVPVQNLVSIPDDIDFVRAAAFPLTFLTAWHMLITHARLKRGEDVLILAAGSGVGQAAIPDCVHARRAGVCHGRVGGELERARGLGAYEVIHHHQQDIAMEIRPVDEQAGRRCRHRTCWRGDGDEERSIAGPRRPPSSPAAPRRVPTAPSTWARCSPDS